MRRALHRDHVFCLGRNCCPSGRLEHKQLTRWTVTATMLRTVRPIRPCCVLRRNAGPHYCRSDYYRSYEDNNTKIESQIEIFEMEKPRDMRCADVNNRQEAARFGDPLEFGQHNFPIIQTLIDLVESVRVLKIIGIIIICRWQYAETRTA